MNYAPSVLSIHDTTLTAPASVRSAVPNGHWSLWQQRTIQLNTRGRFSIATVISTLKSWPVRKIIVVVAQALLTSIIIIGLTMLLLIWTSQTLLHLILEL